MGTIPEGVLRKIYEAMAPALSSVQPPARWEDLDEGQRKAMAALVKAMAQDEGNVE